MSGAWAKGASNAVSSAPPPGRMGGGEGGGRNRNRRGNQQNNRRSNNDGGRGGRSRGGGRGGRGGRGDRRNSNKNQNDQANSIRIVHKDVQLLNKSGLGKTKEQQKVKRIPAREFMRLRLQYLDITSDLPFTPHEQCHWTDDNRVEDIQNLSSKVMELGDVSKRDPPVTAPPLESCTPLEVNEDTRWKSKAMKQKSGILDPTDLPPPETTEEIIGKTLLILNKISWTTLDRLTEQFIEMTQLEINADVRKAVIHLLIEKSQTEHHFGPMYAQLCATIAKQIKAFKKELLSQCQAEFEIDTAHKIKIAVEGITVKEEIEYRRMLIRKSYVGHIKFLGELYKRDVVKLAVMMYCLDELLKNEEDEENLECFAHLMTTMGEKLDGHAKQNKKPFDWNKVVSLRKSQKISNRIRFLLQDLLDLKENHWVTRRKQETAKNIADLHKEIAKEEKAAAKSSKMNRRSNSSNNLRRSQSMASTPAVDDDGFVQISRVTMKNVSSKLDMMNINEINAESQPSSVPDKVIMRRSQSQPASMSTFVPDSSPIERKEIEVLSPNKCSDKAKNLLKEYFVGGDTSDAILTIHEIVQAGSDGCVERGSKVVEGGVFLVMEMKQGEVEKCATVLCRAFKENKLPAESMSKGLVDPLEFLSDIEIDAPLAGSHLAFIIAEFIKAGAIELGTFLKDAPEYFKTDGKPAVFCSKVLKAKNRDLSNSDFELIASLMTNDDKSKFADAKAIYASV